MVITGINSAGCFCADMGDVVISGVESDIIIDFTARYNGNVIHSWSERYTPDAQGVVKVRDLGEIALDYFVPMGLDINFNTVDANEFSYNVGISASITDDEGTQLDDFVQTFYYSMLPVKKSNIEYKFFYNRYSERSVHPEQYIPVAYNIDTQNLKVGVVFKANDTVDYLVLDYGDENDQSIIHRIRNLSPKVIAAKVSEEYGDEISVSDLIYYDASLYYNGGLIDRIKFNLDHRHHKQFTHLIFYNLFGFPETICFTGKDEKSAEMEATFALMNDQYSKIDTELNEIHTINSGYITSTDYESIKDLIRSKEVYIYNGTDKLKIAITDIDLTCEKPKSTPLNVKISYRLANDKDVAFARPGITNNRVFDKTFDYTFA